MYMKVCGMRDPENIRLLMQQVDPDFVGFIFHPGSPRYFLDGTEVIPDELSPDKRVGVFVNSTFDEITGLTEMFALQNIQLHGQESPEFCQDLRKEGFKVIKAFGISGREDFVFMKEYEQACDYFLFDTKNAGHGGSGEKFNWEILEKCEIPKPFFLSGGIDMDDVSTINKLKRKPFAIDINSRFEIKPALKDIIKIKTFKNEFLNHATITQNNG